MNFTPLQDNILILRDKQKQRTSTGAIYLSSSKRESTTRGNHQAGPQSQARFLGIKNRVVFLNTVHKDIFGVLS